MVTGSRVLSLGDRLPPNLDDLAPESVPLEVWSGLTGQWGGPVRSEVPSSQEWRELVRLWRESGITPLAEHIARSGSSWRHARYGKPPVATASAQALADPFPGTVATWLVCCVTTQRSYQGKGLAAACVSAAVPRDEAAVAFIEPPGESRGFFSRIGWSECGRTYLYHYV
jgi:GNAT superfamily N-acetyltransferase